MNNKKPGPAHLRAHGQVATSSPLPTHESEELSPGGWPGSSHGPDSKSTPAVMF